MIQRTQIFFDEDLKKKKEKAKITWTEAVELGIETKLTLMKNGDKNGKHK